MNEIVTVNDTGLAIKEYQGQRVITFRDIDSVHGIKDGTAKRNFTNNKKHLNANEDFYQVSKSELGVNFTLSYGFGKNAATGILLTESGYLMIVKSLTDSIAWKVQRKLVNTYFKAKTIVTEATTQNSSMEKLLQLLLAQQQEQRQAQDATNQQIFQMMIQNQQALTTLITSTLPQPYKPPFTRWMDKIFKQADSIGAALNLNRRQTLHKLYTEIQDSYDIDLSEHTEEYCYQHGIQNNGKYTLNAIGADLQLKQLFQLMVDTHIEQSNLNIAITV